MAKKTLNPVYAAKEATFTFPIYLSLADKLGVLELVAWDKDMLKKDYLGETSLQLESWFKDQPSKDFEDPRNTVSETDNVKSFSSSSDTIFQYVASLIEPGFLSCRHLCLGFCSNQAWVFSSRNSKSFYEL